MAWITNDGSTSLTTNEGLSNTSVAMYDDTYGAALTYQISGGGVSVYTFSISGGVATKIDELTLDAASDGGTDGTPHQIFWIDSTHFIVLYLSSGLTVETFSVNGSYSSITSISSVSDTYLTASNFECNACQLDSSTFIWFGFSGTANDCMVKFFTVDGSYNVTDEVGSGAARKIYDFQFNSANCSICAIDSTHFAVLENNLTNDKLRATSFSVNTTGYTIAKINAVNLSGATNSSRSGYSITKLKADFLVVAGAQNTGGLGLWLLSYDGSYSLTEEKRESTGYGAGADIISINSGLHIVLCYVSSNILYVTAYRVNTDNNTFTEDPDGAVTSSAPYVSLAGCIADAGASGGGQIVIGTGTNSTTNSILSMFTINAPVGYANDISGVSGANIGEVSGVGSSTINTISGV